MATGCLGELHFGVASATDLGPRWGCSCGNSLTINADRDATFRVTCDRCGSEIEVRVRKLTDPDGTVVSGVVVKGQSEKINP